MPTVKGAAWVLLGALVYGLIGLSLGLFYDVTFFGRAAWPLPHPLALTAPALYYVSLSYGLDQAQKSVWWLAAFPVAGGLWLLSGWLAAKVMRAKVTAGDLLRASLLGALPLLVLCPWLVWTHALTPHGPTWTQFLRACEFRDFGPQPSPALLNPLYCVAALAGSWLELRCWFRLAGGGKASAWAALALCIALTGTALIGLAGNALLGAVA